MARFTEKDWRCASGTCTLTALLPRVARASYVRVRGTGTAELEPTMDARGEDPWTDLWFYSNPIFLEVGQ